MRRQFTTLAFEADDETVYGLGKWHSEAYLQYLVIEMYSIYEAESWPITTDAYSTVERMRRQFTALVFEADHETVYGLGKWHSEAYLQYLHGCIPSQAELKTVESRCQSELNFTKADVENMYYFGQENLDTANNRKMFLCVSTKLEIIKEGKVSDSGLDNYAQLVINNMNVSDDVQEVIRNAIEPCKNLTSDSAEETALKLIDCIRTAGLKVHEYIKKKKTN
ncbi:hypothetical protein FQA39_LY04976 [Lamprigera yunnana]|nr:hypothetical protein FQA39_LY04976 [Lamprigera yunnana]